MVSAFIPHTKSVTLKEIIKIPRNEQKKYSIGNVIVVASERFSRIFKK